MYVHTHSFLSTLNTCTLQILYLNFLPAFAEVIQQELQWSASQEPLLHSRLSHSTPIPHSHNKSLDPILTPFIYLLAFVT
jgi:hypothetical protein